MNDLLTKESREPTLSIGYKIANALGVSLDWLANDKIADDIVPDWSSFEGLGEGKRFVIALLEELGIEEATSILFALVSFKDRLNGTSNTDDSSIRRVHLKMGWGDPSLSLRATQEAVAEVERMASTPQPGDELPVDLKPDDEQSPRPRRKRSG